MAKKSVIKENKAVDEIKAVVEKFVPAFRAFSSKTKVREGKAARTIYGRFLVLLSNGRWTVSGEVEGIYTYSPIFEKRKKRTEYTERGRKTIEDVCNYLPALVEVGLLTSEQVEAFKKWEDAEMNERWRIERIADLRNDANGIGDIEVIDRRKE